MEVIFVDWDHLSFVFCTLWICSRPLAVAQTKKVQCEFVDIVTQRQKCDKLEDKISRNGWISEKIYEVDFMTKERKDRGKEGFEPATVLPAMVSVMM